MKLETINSAINKWQDMTNAVLDLKMFSLEDMQSLLKKTYLVLTTYHKESLVPKEISKLLLEMDGLLYFITIMDSEDLCIDLYLYQYISYIINALKSGFFKGEYECPFPKLRIFDAKNNELIIDFDTNIFA
ncbi:MAG: hypothetical protein ACI4KI_00710 [Candidatus Fimenecus sp.]